VRSVRSPSAVAAALVALGVVAAAAPASGQQASPVSAARQQATPLATGGTPAAIRGGMRAVPVVPKSAKGLGQLSASTSLRLLVTLKVRNPVALASFISALSDRKSPLFHHFLRRGQFGARFGATPAQVAKVDAALRSAGLVPGRVSSDRLTIPVRASAAAAERAFGTKIAEYRLVNGRRAYANSAAVRIPAAAAPYVMGVVGLDTVDVPHSLAVRPSISIRLGAPRTQIRPVARLRLAPSASGPRPCSAAASTATADGSFTADQLAGYYGMSPLYGLNDLGQGVHVALAEFEDNSTSDIAAYLACYGLNTTVNYKPVDGGPPSGAGAGEAALDIEDVAGLAPGATIDVYQEPNGGSQDTYDLYQAIIDADADPVVSTSWGECELNADPSLISSEDNLFAQAVTQGQTVLAAAGDSGSTDCLGNGATNASALAVDDPASQPWVVGVGGTSIGASSEAVWNDSAATDGAGGGGLSAVWCMPSYQGQTAIPGVISTYSKPVTGCPSGEAPYARQVPDVSADADPAHGYTIYFGGSWMAIGGTSGAAPLWAAVAALTDASPFCGDWGSGNAGVQPSGLYTVASVFGSPYIYKFGEALSDVTSGNNDYTPSGYTGGLYPATTGYDMASGLGTPLASGYSGPGVASNYFPGLTAFMCAAFATRNVTATISRVVPGAGPVKGGNTITVIGSGFLPIPGAEEAAVGSKIVTTVACSSSTRCTIKLPRESPGTVDIQIAVENGLELTPLTKHDRYIYALAAHISSLSPHSGPARGGTRVTIRGSNFVGTVVVHFGRRTARIVSQSAGKLVVVAPRGSGTVNVTVSAAGGASSPNRASKYRY
jgi:subtilase family serine protease